MAVNVAVVPTTMVSLGGAIVMFVSVVEVG
jgi:hypothetical protein